MRLFIFNNGRLKYVLKEKYINQGDLSVVFKQQIEDKFIQNDDRKKVLWATALRNMATVNLAGAPFQFFSTNDSDGRTIKGTDAYDFFLDRGNGWVSLIKNYSIYREIAHQGNIPDMGTYLTEAKPFPWQVTDTKDQTFITDLITGAKSVIPIGVGNFFGDSYSLTLTDFQELINVSTRASEAIKSVIAVEWSAVVFDNGPFSTIQQTPDRLQNKIDKLNKEIKKTSPLLNQQIQLVRAIRSKQPVDQQQLEQAEGLVTSLTVHLKSLENEKIQDTILFQEFGPFRYEEERNQLLAQKPLDMQTGAMDQDATGWPEYLDKLQTLENYIVTLYRQVRFTTTSANFDDEKLDKTLKQKAYSAFLFTLGGLTKLLGTLIGGVSFSGLPAPGLLPTGAKSSYGAGGVVKDLFLWTSEYFFKKRALYNNGGKESSVADSIENMLDLLIVSYAAYEIFLVKWGIAEIVANRTPQQIETKLIKVKNLIEAKSKSKGLPVINNLQIEVDKNFNAKSNQATQVSAEVI